jgi:hypothetical protein
MASTTDICDSFKLEIFVGLGTHDFTNGTGDAFYWALYTSAATHGTATTAYSTTAELADATGGYDRPGETLANVTPTIDTNVAITDWEDPTWTTASFTAASTLLHNNSGAAVASWDFGSDQTASGGDFVLQLPVYAAATAILRLA